MAGKKVDLQARNKEHHQGILDAAKQMREESNKPKMWKRRVDGTLREIKYGVDDMLKEIQAVVSQYDYAVKAVDEETGLVQAQIYLMIEPK